MRSFVSIGLFVLVGLITAILIGFPPSMAKPLPYDAEQAGLKDRIVIKFSHVVAENTPKGLAAEHFAKLVRERLSDRVEVQVYPNGILYSDKYELDALSRGEVHMIAPSFSNLTNAFPSWGAFDLPFAFPNQQAVDEALYGNIGKQLLAELANANMKGISFWNNGFKQVTSAQRPLIHPADFAGQTFRILPSKVLEQQFHALGAQAVMMPFTEVYRSVVRGDVDGQENTISNIYSKRLYQVQQHMTLSNHGYLGYAIIVNRTFWEELPADVRGVLEQALAETTQWNRELAQRLNDEQLHEIVKSGTMDIHQLSATERDEWIAALAPIYKQVEEEVGASLLQQIKTLRQQYNFDSP
ncbi:DctP family TRAP transporter solute-binding subunit [Paenibacillus sp. 481]|uniref:DctP family TRAP transporter solute-binding subunit n=1 Tax=Paenibacillus sp. 481 TaxID=2835869 RepID=UPI001E3027A5|nr:DctP family TRAP transporter solute-binding subunit [Paenibacillus sp. 481]UHA72193.1 DctP family TRAP transporter solute-binding subunit [Paenibacillus sp. 481]